MLLFNRAFGFVGVDFGSASISWVWMYPKKIFGLSTGMLCQWVSVMPSPSAGSNHRSFTSKASAGTIFGVTIFRSGFSVIFTSFMLWVLDLD
jgi:hypothetical protein